MKKKSNLYYTIFYVILLSFSMYVLLDTFVIPHSIAQVQSDTGDSTANVQKQGKTGDSAASAQGQNETGGSATSAQGQEKTDNSTINADNQNETQNQKQEAVWTDNSYTDENISITIETREVCNTTVYIADVQLSSVEYLKTALANDMFGTNVTETTSAQAEAKSAILAVNGDYYGANKTGYVIKNGTVYRDSVRNDSEYDDLVIYEDGSFGIINETEISAEQLVENGVTQLFAFGPALVENGEIAVDQNSEVGKAMASNPRTAIGVIDELHYVFVVADGRSSESEGLSLYELAELLQECGCETAYNLDGGGSSTMYFNGQVINKPTTNGHSFKEREVSDIVYIGY